MINLNLKVVFELILQIWIFETNCKHKLTLIYADYLISLELLVEFIDLEIRSINSIWDVVD
jgi:hypothetical protein